MMALVIHISKNGRNDNFLVKMEFSTQIQDSRSKMVERIYRK
jgi:hypothetical protein